MAERTTELRPLSPSEIRRNCDFLSRCVLQTSDFTVSGTFSLVRFTRKRWRRQEITSCDEQHGMWASQLLDFDPLETRLSISNDQIRIHNKSSGRVLRYITPKDIREMTVQSFTGKVRASGYVLADPYCFGGEHKRYTPEEFEYMLVEADGGQKPSELTNFTVIKVEPVLQGRKLKVIK